MTVVKDFNEGEYKFNISVMSSKDWTNFTLDVLTARLDTIKGVKLSGTKVSVRDNVAKVMISWETADNAYHEFEFHLDEFGRKSKNYQDLVSNIWQNQMSKFYDKEYVQALQAKLDELNIKTV